MKGKKLIGIGFVMFAVLAAGITATYVIPAVSAAGRGEDAHPWWSEGLTDQQVAEIRQKMWELREQAARENWTTEQLRVAMHNLFAQYGINPQGPYFADANGDGICDHLGEGRGPKGQYRGNYANCTNCPHR